VFHVTTPFEHSVFPVYNPANRLTPSNLSIPCTIIAATRSSILLSRANFSFSFPMVNPRAQILAESYRGRLSTYDRLDSTDNDSLYLAYSSGHQDKSCPEPSLLETTVCTCRYRHAPGHAGRNSLRVDISVAGITHYTFNSNGTLLSSQGLELFVPSPDYT